MAFLHGVLESVKDDENVTTYDGYITVENDKLQKLLDSLQSSIGQGRSEFGDRVEKVNDKTSDVKTKLGKYVQEVTRQQDQSLEAQLFQWTTTLGYIAKDIHSINIDKIMLLDTALSTRIMHKVEPIQKSVEVLLGAANNLDLKGQAKNVDELLEQQKKNVVYAINHGVEKLQRTMAERFREILAEILILREKRGDSIKAIRGAISLTKGGIDGQLGKTSGIFKNKILTHFDEIKKSLLEVNKNDNPSRKAGTSKLKQETELIKSVLLEVGQELKRHVDSLQERIQQADQLRDAAFSKAEEVYNELMKERSISDSIAGKLGEIDGDQSAIGGVHSQLTGIDVALNQWLNQADHVFHSALLKVDEIIKEVNDTKQSMITQAVADLKSQTGKHFLALKKSQLQGYAHQATHHLANLANIVECLVEETFKAAKSAYETWVKNGTQRVDPHISAKVSEQIGRLETISSAVQNAAKQASQGSSRGAQLYATMLPGRLINALQSFQLHPQLQSIRRGRPPQPPSDAHTATLHLLSLSEFASTITKVVNDTISFLNIQIKTGEQNASTINSGSNIDGLTSQLIAALQSASQFADQLQPLNTDIQSMIQSAWTVDRRLNIKESVQSLSALPRDLMNFESHFNTEKSLFDNLEQNITRNFNALVNAVRHETGPPTGLKKVLGDFRSDEISKGTDSKGLQKINKDLHAQQTTLSSHPGAIHQAVSNITSKLGELQKQLKNTSSSSQDDKGALDKLEALEEKLGHKTSHEQCIKAVCNKLSKLHTNEFTDKKAGKIQNFIQGVLDVVTQLENVPEDVGKKKEAVIQLMDELKVEIDGLFKNIDDVVNEADEAFINIIVSMENTVLRAKHLSEQTIKTLKETLLDEVRKAFENVTNDVRVLFANGHRADLSALKSLVSAQLTEIKSIISRDRITGPKGLLRLVKISLQSITSDHKTMRPFAVEIKKFFEDLCHHLQLQSDITGEAPQIKTLHASLDAIFDKLLHHQHFHHSVSQARQAFESALQAFHADTFPDAPKKVLQPLKQGLEKFATELQKQYVSRYSGETFTENLEDRKDLVNPGEDVKEIYTLTDYGRKAAQVLLTIMHTFNRDMNNLSRNCNNSWAHFTANPLTRLGIFLKRCGYRISEEKQDGELRNKSDCNGQHIYDLIVGHDGVFRRPDPDDEDAKTGGDYSPVYVLYQHIQRYYALCHLTLPSKTTYPCSIRDMLSWMCGLPYTAVYNSVFDHCTKQLKEETDNAAKNGNEPDTVIKKILDNDLVHNLSSVCKKSRTVLVTIQGHGRGFDKADYPYACNFHDNSRNFHYPGDVRGLLDVINEICSRLLRALYFLYCQCQSTASVANGWAECLHGQGVPSANWQCKDHPRGKANEQPNGQPTSQANSQPKSPLQAHLTDSLLGCLPHKLTSVGCSSKCLTCPKGTPGQQCITPMGFWDLTHAASITLTGSDICDVLSKLCGNADSPLATLSRCLETLTPSPPRRLSDMFPLFCNLFQKWGYKSYVQNADYKYTVDSAINQCFPFHRWYHDNYQATHLTDKLSDLYFSTPDHPTELSDQKHCDLWSLTTKSSCSSASSCAPYLQSMSTHAHHTYAPKHARMYLSWVSYLTWDFWKLLHDLLESFKSISCKAYGCGCNCRSGEHGVTDKHSTKAGCHCSSIVNCQGVSSTFYKYGFTFHVPKDLAKKTCDDFVKQLSKVLHQGYFKELFDEIDNFIWAIRLPFSITLLALWSLSLLYLLHITVVRLDVLRIRSHLRSPSSHRIAAQSLLAAARVKALANVKDTAKKDLAERRISLGQLAGQLSGFIGGSEEVQNALVNGLHSNVNQLEKLLKTSCGDGKCNCDGKKFRDEHLDKLQNQFNEVDEIATKIDGLNKQKDEKRKAPVGAPSGGDREIAELNEKIRQHKSQIFSQSSKLTTQITSVISAVEKKIDELEVKKKKVDDLQSQVNGLKKQIEEGNKNPIKQQKDYNEELKKAEEELKNAKNAFPENDSKSLDSHQTSMKSLNSLEKLCQHCDDIKTNKENTPKNILENLTEGLEKFLGHSNGNYTGEGIVYSDLDRLCDGVMAFLHGVLESVKDDVSVKKYDGYINPENQRLDQLLKNLKASIGKGSGAFGPQVTAVSGWLGRYESEVNKKCEAVTNGINALSDNLSKGYSNVVDSKKVDSLKDQLASWESTVSDISREVKNIEEDKVSELDKALKERVMGEMKVVKKAVGMLLGAAGEDGLEKQVQTVDKTLERTKNEIKRDIKEKFSKIDESVRKLGGTKNKQIGHLNDRLKDARDFLDRYNQDYKTEIERLFTQLHGRMNNINPHHPDPAGKESELKKKFTAVTEAVDGIEKAYKDKFADVKKKVDAAVDQALEKDMQHSLDKLDDHIRTDLEGLRNSIKLKLEAFAGSLGTKIKEAAKLAKGSGRGDEGLKTLISQFGSGGSAEPFTQLVRELEKLRGNYAVGGTIEGVLYNLRRLEEVSSGTAVYAELLATVRKSLYAAIDKVLKGVIMDPKSIIKFDTAFMSNYYKETKKEDGTGIGTFRGLIMTIKSEFGKGIERPDPNGDVSVDPTKFESQFNYKTDDGQGAKDKYDQAKQAISPTIIDELEALPQQVDAKRKEAVERMSALYTELNNKFNYIYELVHKASGAIDISITSLQSTLNSSQEACLTSVSQAFQTLTTEVRALFAQGHKADLAALKTLVDGQKGEIDGIIFNDKISGIKGLLSALNTHNDKISRIPVGEFKYAAEKSKHYLDAILDYIRLQVRTPAKAPGQDPELSDESKKVWNVSVRLDALLNYLKDDKPHPDDPTGKRIYTFDHQSGNLLASLTAAVTNLTSPNFHGFHNPLLLDALRSGMTQFTEQLGHAYVNKYSGMRFQSDLLVNKPKDPVAPNAPASQASLSSKPSTVSLASVAQIPSALPSQQLTAQTQDSQNPEKVLSTEGRNCAKVCLTILEILSEDLGWLKKQCESEWASRTIYSGSSLGTFLQNCGYRVVTNRDSQNGELQYTNDMKGEHVYERLVNNHHTYVYNTDKNIKHAFENFYDYLKLYYDVCHLATSFSKKRPCSIYEMLAWCTSLLHHPVYFDLTTNDFGYLFDEPKKKEADSMEFDGISLEEPSSLSLAAYPQKIAQSEIHDAIVHVTSLAPVILTTIVGFGDEFTTYAVDYHTNALGFTYPSSAGDCLNMLLECLRRMFPVFRFLHSRCDKLASEYGWYQCPYGRDVESSDWQCDKHSKTLVDCRPRSPLMSFLRDTLPGHLPHQLTSVDCKSICSTCPKSMPGQPCLTPLGFRGFSGSKRSGKDLSKVLSKYFDKGVGSPLLSVAPKPPRTLPEHFQFALSFVKGWSHSGGNGLKTVTEKAAKSVSIDLYNEPSKLTHALRNAYRNTHSNHGGKDHLPAYADVSSLAMAPACNDAVGNALCAPYVASLSCDSYYYMAEKHANLYLSWAIYLPWTFWDLLNNLYNAFCNITCADWGCRGCLRGDKCRKGKHGVVEDDKKPNPTCQCDSIVSCRGVAPTLYQYGFTFGEASTLNSGDTAKKCKDFCTQLHNVLHSTYFTKLFEACDEFLKEIRWPFMLTLLALWSLSLLYLLHIAVVRLDVLRIRSHLKSPSSHRIAAQSLLAAARVKALANVKYFSP
ncbi:hypothetical protein, conserved [Babesia ovata]|uniref:Extracellular matrix-binding ebh n=1 Tax=Babesia ovata TaxID=189622 RepID=A0A2H6KJI0_9APIC|nr:uncharacterized protein BOVATA_046450 [Babesia ovata]GBE63152.1 hypothetical protein, conserved [Babesia ovata]